MDLTTTPNYLYSPPPNGESSMEANPSFYRRSTGTNPFADSFPDPRCNLNLRETSEFVNNEGRGGGGFLDVSIQRKRQGTNLFTHNRRIEGPCSTPLGRKSYPSKWDDAEKWLISTSCNHSPVHALKPPPVSIHKHFDVNFRPQMEEDKSTVTQEKVSSFQGSVSNLDHHSHNSLRAFNGSTNVLLKDKFTDDIEPVISNFRYSEPSKEGFLFKSERMKDASSETIVEVQHRDFGTEMTPLGSSTTSRCHTPFKSSSPARHNTPASRSGPLLLDINSSSVIDITQLQDCHLAKLCLGTQYDSLTSNWSSREEEEEDISKSLRHFETGIVGGKSVSDSRAAAWEGKEKNECCLRYQREEEKIQAWVNLQNAKAEAQSRKLEVKIEKMRSNLEERLMKRMSIVHRKADEWRAADRNRNRDNEKIIKRQNSQLLGHSSTCGCFPSL